MIKKTPTLTLRTIIQFLVASIKQPWRILAFLLVIDFLIATHVLIQALNFKITTINSGSQLKKIKTKQYQIIKNRSNSKLFKIPNNSTSSSGI
ncbi:MAG TPA: hypothetical protein ENL06_00095 [Candidatus Portnoybacteria bacterium]|nr:hypothetical protein [Candidatus Portnoybacteria bacterium]